MQSFRYGNKCKKPVETYNIKNHKNINDKDMDMHLLKGWRTDKGQEEDRQKHARQCQKASRIAAGSVLDPYPDWIQIQWGPSVPGSGFTIRIRIHEGKNDQ